MVGLKVGLDKDQIQADEGNHHDEGYHCVDYMLSLEAFDIMKDSHHISIIDSLATEHSQERFQHGHEQYRFDQQAQCSQPLYRPCESILLLLAAV